MQVGNASSWSVQYQGLPTRPMTMLNVHPSFRAERQSSKRVERCGKKIGELLTKCTALSIQLATVWKNGLVHILFLGIKIFYRKTRVLQYSASLSIILPNIWWRIFGQHMVFQRKAKPSNKKCISSWVKLIVLFNHLIKYLLSTLHCCQRQGTRETAVNRRHTLL